jgi:DNA-binding PadR family transcriptional regulator
MGVRREIERRSGRDATLGAVYATLARLEDKEYLRSESGVGDESRRGRPRRYFRLLPEGARVLQHARDVHDSMWKGIDLAAAAGVE